MRSKSLVPIDIVPFPTLLTNCSPVCKSPLPELKNKVSLYYKMSGGIAQLVAVGAQDVHLVGQPEVSFFRSTYKRHTNFSQTVERQVIQGNVANGGMSTVRFERKGDMLGYVYLVPNDGTKTVAYSQANWLGKLPRLNSLSVVSD